MLFDFIADFLYGITHRKEIKRMKQSLEEANKPENRNKPRVYHGKNFGYWAEKWYEDGAQAIGGCCRTTPEDIKEAAEFRDRLTK